MENIKLNRILKTPSLIIFGLAYMVPVAAFTTYGLITNLTKGHVAGAYVLTLATMLFTAYSYSCMVKANPTAGSAYGYVKNSFGINIGFLTGWVLLLDYLFLPMLNYVIIGVFLGAEFPQISSWIWSLIAVIFITFINLIGIITIDKLNKLFISFQVIFIIFFISLGFKHIYYGTIPINPLEPFFSTDMDYPNLFTGAAILALSFLGFDAVSTMSEEAINPTKTVPRAIMGCTLIGGCIYILISWIAQMSFPDYQNFTDIDSASRDVVLRIGNATLVIFFTASMVISSVASAMTSQASVSRILYSMGRDKTLPSNIFGELHAKFRTPYKAILIVGFISLLSLFITLEFIASIISFGALVAFSFVNLTVIKYYLFEKKSKTFIKHGLLPLIGIICCLWLWKSLSMKNFIVGGVWFFIGFCLLIYQKAKKV